MIALTKKATASLLLAALFCGTAAQAATFKSIKSEIEDPRFYTKLDYVHDHAADYISKIDSSTLAQDEKVKLWNLFVRRLMTLLFVLSKYEQTFIGEGSRPSSLPDGFVSDVISGSLNPFHASKHAIYSTAQSAFEGNWETLESKLKTAKTFGKGTFLLFAVPMIIIACLANSENSDRIKYSAAATAGSAVMGMLFYKFFCFLTKIAHARQVPNVGNFETFINRLKAIMASESYTATMPPSIKEQVARALSDAEQHAIPASDQELATEEGKAQLKARQQPMHDLFVALDTDTVYGEATTSGIS